MLGGFHKNEEAGKMHDTGHVGIAKLYAPLGVKFVGHMARQKNEGQKNFAHETHEKFFSHISRVSRAELK